MATFILTLQLIRFLDQRQRAYGPLVSLLLDLRVQLDLREPMVQLVLQVQQDLQELMVQLVLQVQLVL
jgi:hypothetical protein